MRVDASAQQTVIFVGVTFGSSSERQDFTPDTGASTTTVDAHLAKQAGMKPTGVKTRNNTACSVITTPLVNSGGWALAGHQLAPQAMGTANLITSGPAAGLLGADVMNRYGSVVFDYRGGRLILGAG